MTTGNVTPETSKQIQALDKRVFELERALRNKKTDSEAPRTQNPSCGVTLSDAVNEWVIDDQDPSFPHDFDAFTLWESQGEAFWSVSDAKLRLARRGIWIITASMHVRNVAGTDSGPIWLYISTTGTSHSDWISGDDKFGGSFTFTDEGLSQEGYLSVASAVQVTSPTSAGFYSAIGNQVQPAANVMGQSPVLTATFIGELAKH